LKPCVLRPTFWNDFKTQNWWNKHGQKKNHCACYPTL
jgi:hypothetical protein